jgi:S1-C subfamily serine protease
VGSLIRTLRHVATKLIGPVAALVASDPSGAATPPDWVFAQRMELNGHSATHCYDRLSLRKEATVVRVRVKSSVANRILADGCQTLTDGADGMTYESEILVRCRDRMWAQTVDSRRHRLPEPVPEEQWRTARVGEYRNLVDQICAVAPRLRYHGSASYGNGLGSGEAKPPPPGPGASSDVAGRKEAARTAPAAEGRRRNESGGRPSSGSGFFVDETGHILTNDHVVESCRRLTVVAGGKRWRAVIVARNSTLDLALLKAATATTAYASFRAAAPPRAGETVIAAGYPLRGLLASGPIVSTGIVNAVAGIRDDTTRFQISAPVQPGNSGGPLLDASGNVIGIVVSKLDAIKLAQATGDMPQNVNFAVKGEFARAFLEKNGISPRMGRWARPIDAVGVAAIAKSMTVPVDCQ